MPRIEYSERRVFEVLYADDGSSFCGLLVDGFCNTFDAEIDSSKLLILMTVFSGSHKEFEAPSDLRR